ncbi:hypothetical protein [Cryobacterium cryoconiti]|uniref:Oligosaccharide repeat unit polymerase n=1 Tax=Cryobacterium cryoconiti TaxID=1259239 RepID=A0A4Y8JU83_9MICO|nr:hypothetical protein [Cryobacterium cryoconiti]TFD30222.1 hypothetical protein E3T49_08415 [Cryobacterium cryoconiti]
MTALMAGTVVSSIVGYRWGTGQRQMTTRPVHENRIPEVVAIGFIASLLLVIPMSQAYSGFSVLNLGDALNDQAGAYAQSSERILEGFDARSGIVLLQTVLAPFTLTALPYLAMSWFERRKHGLLFLSVLAAPTLMGILVARDQQIGLSGIVVFGAWVLSRVRRRMPLRRPEKLVLFLLAVGLFFAFGARKALRSGNVPLCPPGATECAVAHNHPSAFEVAGIYFSSYASQGLEGLGRALDATWTFGGGLSHSQALASMVNSLLGVNPQAVVTSQLFKLEWSDSWYWSTALTSLANDVPWIFVPVVIGLQAAVLGLVWRSAIEDGDWLSITVFCYTWLGLLFVPQNLQLAISGPTYVGYIVLLSSYLIRSLLQRHADLSRLTPGTEIPIINK